MIFGCIPPHVFFQVFQGVVEEIGVRDTLGPVVDFVLCGSFFESEGEGVEEAGTEEVVATGLRLTDCAGRELGKRTTAREVRKLSVLVLDSVFFRCELN